MKGDRTIMTNDQHITNLKKLRSFHNGSYGESINVGIKALEQQKTGEWIYDCRPVYGNPYGHYECSNCKREFAYKENYCPSCGARMIEPQERSGEE